MYCFTAAVMMSLLEKCCTFSSPSIGLNRQNSDSIKSRLYRGHGRTIQPRLAVLHGLPTTIRPGVITLQKKIYLLHWPDSGSSSLHLIQHHDAAIRVGGFSSFQKVQKDHSCPIPKDNAYHFTH